MPITIENHKTLDHSRELSNSLETKHNFNYPLYRSLYKPLEPYDGITKVIIANITLA